MDALNPRTQNWLDEFTADAERGRLGEATAALTAQLNRANVDAATWEHAAQTLIHSGHCDAAATLLGAALLRHPNQLDLHYWRGNALRIIGRFDAAESELRAVLASDSTHREATLSLAFMLREQGRIDAAAAAVVALWQTRKGERETAIIALDFLQECGAHRQARDIAHHAAAVWPDDAGINARAGEILIALGEFDAAHTMLRRALDLDATQSSAWMRLASCQRYQQEDDADIRRFRSTLANNALGPVPRICAGFALGKALDDLGDYAQAVRVLRQANASAAEVTPWNAQQWQHFVGAQIVAPTLPRADYDPGFTPVFIVGLPRAGTTLVAARLDNHPDVRDRGELNWIAAMYAHLQSQQQLHDVQALTAVARLVAAQMRRDDGSPRCIIDKNPLNFRHLDLIQALFPNARIIHCRRSERDTALSLWQQHFAHDDLAFSHRFDSISLFIKGYDRLIAHWRESLALPCLDVRYEAMVADEAGELQRLGQFLDLPHMPDGAPAASSTITTASVWQARQPTYLHSIGRWKNYAAHLPELEQLFSV